MEYSRIETVLPKRGDKSAYNMKVENIEVINKYTQLLNDSYEYGVLERRVLVRTTKFGEKIYIQFPGKETKNTKPNIYDFKPIVQRSDGSFVENISFSDIWNDLSSVKDADKNMLSCIAAIFYRMSMMEDHRKLTLGVTSFDVIMASSPNERLENATSGSIETYVYDPSSEVRAAIEGIEGKLGKLHGVSFEAFLVLIDLLAQNEDCKYCSRNVAEGKKWDGKTGRLNTLWTIIAVIGYLIGYFDLATLLQKFHNGRGVAKITVDDVVKITGDLVHR